IALAGVLILIRSAAYLSIPSLVGLGIDRGVRPGTAGDLTTLGEIGIALIGVLVINALSNYAFLRLSGRIGQQSLFDRRTLVLALTWWFRHNSARSYRAVRRAIVLVIVQYVESLGGIRAVHAFRREPRNQQIFEDVNGRYRDANIWSNRLASTFGPGISLLG